MAIQVGHIPEVVGHSPEVVGHILEEVGHIPEVVGHIPVVVDRIPVEVDHIPVVAGRKPMAELAYYSLVPTLVAFHTVKADPEAFHKAVLVLANLACHNPYAIVVVIVEAAAADLVGSHLQQIGSLRYHQPIRSFAYL